MVTRLAHTGTWVEEGAPGSPVQFSVYPEGELPVLEAASALLEEWRLLGQAPRYDRAVSSAHLLVEMAADPEAVCVSLLRGLDADRLAASDKLQGFPEDVRLMMDDLTRSDKLLASGLSGFGAHKVEDPHWQEGLRKLLLALAQDIRVVVVMLAERVFDMRQAAQGAPENRIRLARQTLALQAPLANRIGVWQLKWELEDLSFRYLEPEVYHQVAKLLDERRAAREQYIADLIARLRQELSAHAIRGEVFGRPKHIYSIWRKMRAKNLSFQEVLDIRAVRIVVDDIESCYQLLSIVRGLWSEIPGSFDDYIAQPKGNRYRSLHTALVGPEGKPMEVQIRTWEMHHDSEYGVAAHWRYKEGTRSDRQFDERIAWLREMLEWRSELVQGHGAGFEALESSERPVTVAKAPARLLDDDVYVFTPKGRIVDLPQGSTPLDFAYHVHTDLGHRCRGAKVDGQIVPLTYTLKQGQRVEILSTKSGGPSRDWLNTDSGVLRSPRAQAKVRQWFKHALLEEDIGHGRAMLERILQRVGRAQVSLDKLTTQSGKASPEDLLVSLYRGDITVRQVEQWIQALKGEVAPRPEAVEQTETLQANVERPKVAEIQFVGGLHNIASSLAKCCHPLPPERIVGFVTRGRGVSLHRTDCKGITQLSEDQAKRLIPADWSEVKRDVYPADLRVIASDRRGLLRDMTEVFTREKVNVSAVNTQSRGERAQMSFTLEVRDLTQCARIVQQLGQIDGVLVVERKNS